MNKKKSYYISYGTGSHQEPLIRAALEQGYKVVGVDQDIQSAGMSLCDIKIEESILNFRKIYKKLSLLPVDLEIVGGFSASFGKAILSWAYLVERLKLNGLTRPLTEVLLDKYETRRTLKESKIKNKLYQQPRFTTVGSYIVLNNLVEKVGFPMVIKPKQGYAKKDIFLIEDMKKLKKFLNKGFLKEKNINPGKMIFEGFVPGNEITVVGFVQNFRFHLVSISDKRTSPYPPFIEVEHTSPSMFHGLKETIEGAHQNIVDALQIPSSPVVSEWKYRNRHLYLIEISPQIPGEYIGQFLIPSSLEYDYFANLVRLTLDQNIETPTWENVDLTKTVRVKYWIQKPLAHVWESWQRDAQFHVVLNETPNFPPESNHDRYGAMGFVL